MKWMISLVAVSLSQAATASDWWMVSEQKHELVFVDRDSRKGSAIIEVWQRSVDGRATIWPWKFTHFTDKLVRLNCNEKLHTIAQIIRKNSIGKIQSSEKPADNWTHIKPGSADEEVYLNVCMNRFGTPVGTDPAEWMQESYILQIDGSFTRKTSAPLVGVGIGDPDFDEIRKVEAEAIANMDRIAKSAGASFAE